ncbi:cysteine hydrolase [Rhodobacteraceae bacterium B1Z28]|uniref:Cysteine hydrolase n=1 Tax=Ruegeria haliotis TaxID=2747601 RepID=A0ABX2PS43_9RHOB|nr:cysteine hydrolase [Ruegeria haliotis]NVO56985.1 cysteine hydrolase [Ruegeria haliotis]
MTALIALDYINDMVTETGKAAIAYPEVARRGVIKKLNASTAIARDKGWQVYFVNIAIDEHCLPAESQLSTMLGEAGACQFGSPGVELASDVARLKDDILLRRYRLSAFQSALPSYLRPGETLYVCGVSTSLCVSSTVREAFERNYPVKIIEDACAAESQSVHEAEVGVLSMLAELVTSDSL